MKLILTIFSIAVISFFTVQMVKTLYTFTLVKVMQCELSVIEFINDPHAEEKIDELFRKFGLEE